MEHLKIACTEESKIYFSSNRKIVLVENTDYIDAAAVVLTDKDKSLVKEVYNLRLGIPVILLSKDIKEYTKDFLEMLYRLVPIENIDKESLSKEIEEAANEYEEKMLPPFFKTLSGYVERGNLQFNCPGHQGGKYFRKHPAGRYLYEFYGERIFRSDICNADVALGDLLIH